MELCCAKVAIAFKEMSVEEIREYYHIEHDYTEEEIEKIKEENKVALENL